MQDCELYIIRLMRNSARSKYKAMKWSCLIGFYAGNYLVLSLIGQLSINDLRLGGKFTIAENVSSIIGLLLVTFEVVFPVVLCAIYLSKFKHLKMSEN